VDSTSLKSWGGGASGALRQEFYELELLDDITMLCFENKLPLKVAMADCRKTLIALFREERGSHYMLCKLHKALRWNKCNPFFKCNESHNGEIKWKFIRSLSVKNKSELLEGIVHEGRIVMSASVTVENVKQLLIYDLSANRQKNIKR
jgi:hypothetical protein